MIRVDQAERIGDYLQIVCSNAMPKEHVVSDLLAVSRECGQRIPGRFRAVGFDGRHNAIRFTTEPIVLGDVNLGDFMIRLRLSEWQSRHLTNICRIRPLHRNPFAPRSNAHPHLSGQALCFGDGADAALAAIRRGDPVSVARIINAALHVYNPASPYAELSRYRAPGCWDCGGVSVTRCSCGNYICPNCRFMCDHRANAITCSNTQGVCSACRCTYVSDGVIINLCRSCTVRCAECGVPIPRDESRLSRTTYGRSGYFCDTHLAEIAERTAAARASVSSVAVATTNIEPIIPPITMPPMPIFGASQPFVSVPITGFGDEDDDMEVPEDADPDEWLPLVEDGAFAPIQEPVGATLSNNSSIIALEEAQGGNQNTHLRGGIRNNRTSGVRTVYDPRTRQYVPIGSVQTGFARE